VIQKCLCFICHSGLDPESSVFGLNPRLRENDGLGIYVKKHYTNNLPDANMLRCYSKFRSPDGGCYQADGIRDNPILQTLLLPATLAFNPL